MLHKGEYNKANSKKGGSNKTPTQGGSNKTPTQDLKVSIFKKISADLSRSRKKYANLVCDDYRNTVPPETIQLLNSLVMELRDSVISNKNYSIFDIKKETNYSSSEIKFLRRNKLIIELEGLIECFESMKRVHLQNDSVNPTRYSTV